MTIEELRIFESEIADAFNAKKIFAPIHLSYGNEEQLMKIFESINRQDWVFSTWRSHYHALLHGISPDWLRKEIMTGRSISINCPSHHFFSSAIVGGTIPIANGVAMGIKKRGESHKVWVFIGDMTSELGVFYENVKYAQNFDLPIEFVIEDNGKCIDSITQELWGSKDTKIHDIIRISDKVIKYSYRQNKYPHTGSGTWTTF